MLFIFYFLLFQLYFNMESRWWNILKKNSNTKLS